MTKNIKEKYKRELILLRKNEDASEFFYELLVANMRIDRKFSEKLLNFLMDYCKKYKLYRTLNGLTNFKAWIYHIDREYDKSIDLGIKGYYKAEEFADLDIMSRMCNLLMANYSEIGLIDIANEWGIKGIQIAKKLSNNQILYSLYLNMAIGYAQIKDYKHLQIILDNIENNNFEKTLEGKMTEFQINAKVAIYKKQSKTARKYLDEIKKLSNEITVSYYSCETYRLEGMYFQLINDYISAVEYFRKSFEIIDSSNDSRDYCSSLYSWAKFYYDIGKPEEAIKKLLSCIDIAEKNNLINYLLDAYELIIILYEEGENLSLAYKYLKNISSLKEKLAINKTNKYYNKMSEINVDREINTYKQLYEKLYNLSELGRKIISTFEIDEMISILDEGMRPLMEYNVFSIIMYDEAEDLIVGKYINHLDGKIKSNDEILEYRVENVKDTNTLSSFCVKNRKEILINNIEDLKKYTDEKSEYYQKLITKNAYRSYIFVPLIIQKKLVGLLTVQSYRKNVYSINEVNSLNILSNYISIALQNSNDYKNIEKIAKYDALTGLYSRNEIVKICERELSRNDVYNSLIVIDIDKFKSINDTFGHIEGDFIIKIMAEIMKKNSRKTDYVGRYGGDEFIVFLSDTKKELAYIMANRIRNAVNDSCIELKNGNSLNVSISMGVYTFNENEKLDEGFKKADEALYIAKNKGGNKVVQYNSIER